MRLDFGWKVENQTAAICGAAADLLRLLIEKNFKLGGKIICLLLQIQFNLRSKGLTSHSDRELKFFLFTNLILTL